MEPKLISNLNFSMMKKRNHENIFHNNRNLTDTNVCISIKWNGLADGQKPYKVGISQMHRMSPSIRE